MPHYRCTKCLEPHAYILHSPTDIKYSTSVTSPYVVTSLLSSSCVGFEVPSHTLSRVLFRSRSSQRRTALSVRTTLLWCVTSSTRHSVQRDQFAFHRESVTTLGSAATSASNKCAARPSVGTRLRQSVAGNSAVCYMVGYFIAWLGMRYGIPLGMVCYCKIMCLMVFYGML